MIPLLLALLVASPQSADGSESIRLRAEHRRCVETERTAALLEGWIRADERARLELAERVNSARLRGAALAARPPLVELIDATREFRRGSPLGPLPPARRSEQRGLQEFADALDLALQPGAFEARAEGLGEALTVHVGALLRPRLSGDLTLALVWVGPDGQQIVARREPATVSILIDGVPMFVRPPASQPGTWTLAAQVEREGLAARGVGVRVECLKDLRARAERALRTTEGVSLGDARLQRSLRLLLELGVRSGVALSPGRTLALLEGRGAPTWPRPVEQTFAEPGGREGWLWMLRPAGPLERTLVLVAPETELPDLVFAGTLGERWLGLAAEHRALLLSIELPTSSADTTPAQLFARLRGVARELGVPEAGELIAIGRGAAGVRLSYAVPRETYDAAVLSTVLPLESVSVVLEGVPRLLVAPGGSASFPDGAEPLDELVWVDGSPTSLFNDPRLPELVGTWLEARGESR